MGCLPTNSGARTAVRLRRFAVGVAVSLAAATTMSVAARADSTIVVREGKRRIVVLSPRNGATQTLVRLRRGAILASAASLDGEVVAYVARTLHRVEEKPVTTTRIWILKASNRPRCVKTIVSRGAARATGPIDSVALSPDGGRLLFETKAARVYLMRSDGTGQREVRASRTFSQGSGRNSTGPEFTPDGKRIIAAFYPSASTPRAHGGIGTVGFEGGLVHLIRRSRSINGWGRLDAPTISPDGSHIAFRLQRRSGDSIWVMRRGGADAHKVVSIKGWLIANPSFSPAGRALAFVGTRPNVNGITVIGRSPSALFAVGLGNRRTRRLQTETAHVYLQSPNWVR